MNSNVGKTSAPNGRIPTLTRPKLSNRLSFASLHTGDASFPPTESSPTGDQDNADATSYLSLAHELAAAAMPNPGPNSSLAEELGLDFGDDDASDVNASSKGSEADATTPFANTEPSDAPIIAARHDASSSAVTDDETHHAVRPATPRPLSPIDGSLATSKDSRASTDTLERLAQELAETDAFIARLKRLDTDTSRDLSSHTSTSELPIERYTSHIVRQLNDIAREREIQIRELVSIDKEFRKIEGDAGGSDVLGSLDALDDNGSIFPETGGPKHGISGRLQPLEEADELEGIDQEEIPQDDASGDPHPSAGDSQTLRRVQQSYSDSYGAATPAGTIPHLSRMRDATASLARSLSVMSEHAQENGAATADAGRKIRALKNRIIVWQTEWDSAETSRAKVNQWETDAIKCVRTDGRVIAQQQIDGFAQALADAALKMQAIVVSSQLIV
jgi:hypothetical protein